MAGFEISSTANDSAILAAGLSKELRKSRGEAGIAKSPSSPSITSGSPAHGGSTLEQKLASCVALQSKISSRSSTPKRSRVDVFPFSIAEKTPALLSPVHSSDSSIGDMERTTSQPASPSMTPSTYFSRHGKEIASSPPTMDMIQRKTTVAGESSRLQMASSVGAPTTRSSSVPPAGRTGIVAAQGKVAKTRRQRPSKRPFTTTVQTEAKDFKATVQSLTGCPATASRLAAPKLSGLPSHLRRENSSDPQASASSQRPLPLPTSGTKDIENHMQAVVEPARRLEAPAVSIDPAPAILQPVPARAIPQPALQAPVSMSHSLLNDTFGYASFGTMFDHLRGDDDLSLPPQDLEDHCIFSRHPSELPLDTPSALLNPHEHSKSGSESPLFDGVSITEENYGMDDVSRNPATQSGEYSCWLGSAGQDMFSPTANGMEALNHFKRLQFLPAENLGDDNQCTAAEESDQDDYVNSFLSAVGFDHNTFRP